ncbi:hypothetical protein [Modestobacter italicus]|uniref:hypothetical protein n=1 Tax=Modestobacter italicus (strain DSM 44449 / CECT 9708 / BC 501) TaxID=2732864 RepID=UPI001C989F65|nr:hypothetical protein [Modestobacter italicus]
MTTLAPPALSPFIATLRRLYLLRAVFAVVWAAVLLGTSPDPGPSLAALLAVYPLADAAAVLWQLRAEGDAPGPRVAEWGNVLVSLVVAVALGWAGTDSISTALAIWGAWAAASGITQLVTAVLHRSAGGQVPQIVSGAISVLAGAGFIAQSAQDPTSMAGAGGYAVLGGVFFLVSAVRLNALLRRTA